METTVVRESTDTATHVGIADYGIGDVGSVRNTLRRSGMLANCIDSPDQMEDFDRIILPRAGQRDDSVQPLCWCNYGYGLLAGCACDIVNAAQIFNSKMVDEPIVIDIGVYENGVSQPHVIRDLAEDHRAGEMIIQSIDRDLVRSVVAVTSLSVAALGGADTVNDRGQTIVEDAASAAAAGSMFAFYGRPQVVLINDPSSDERASAAAQSANAVAKAPSK